MSSFPRPGLIAGEQVTGRSVDEHGREVVHNVRPKPGSASDVGALPAIDVHVLPDYEAMSQFAASAVLAAIRRLGARSTNSPLKLVFSAGQTPVRLYELLANRCAEVDWSRTDLYQMDEYVDASSADHDFSRYLLVRVVHPLGIRSANLLSRELACSKNNSWEHAIREHERRLMRSGGIDLVLHGIGMNGHLGFNEPGSNPEAAGAVVPLSASTRAAMGPGLDATLGVTLGLRVLLAARETILLASGAHKAEAVARCIAGAVGPECPASFIRRSARVTVALDAAAAKLLNPPYVP